MMFLNEVRLHHLSKVGGKAANLGNMASAFPVPQGFVLPTTFFHEFAQRVLSEVDKLIANCTEATCAETSSSCRSLFTTLSYPPEQQSAILQMFDVVKERASRSNASWAVRSSGLFHLFPWLALSSLECRNC